MVKFLVLLAGQTDEHPSLQIVSEESLRKIIYTFSQTIFTANLMGIAWTVSETFKHLVTLIRSVWPWMKVKVNTINTCCSLMSEAFTVPSLMMMTVIVSEELLARDRHTDTVWSILNFSKSLRTLKTKRELPIGDWFYPTGPKAVVHFTWLFFLI